MGSPINSNKHQVFLCSSLAIMPFSIACHPWFVVNETGVVSRWEVLTLPDQADTSWGHIHKDAFPPFQGIRVLPFPPRWHWPTRIHGKASGELAKNIIATIKTSPDDYPYPDQYKLLGPNSNTYAQWILDRHPEFGTTLPWNAIGKNFNVDI
jgi:hypothetical protein